MSIYKTAYDTSAGSGFVTDSIKHSLKELYVAGMRWETFDITNNTPIKVRAITGSNNAETTIKVFAHPLLVECCSGSNKETLLYSDFRNVVGFNKENYETVVRNQTEFKLAKLRLVLNLIWLVTKTETLRNISVVPAAVYSSFISEAISRKFALNPGDQAKVAVIAAAFYFNLFKEESSFSTEKREDLQIGAIKATKVPYNIVEEVIPLLNKLDTLQDLCNSIKEVVDNPSLQDLSSGLMISLLAGGWFGSNSRELVATGLEHPPTWIALVYMALNERSYHNAQLSKLAERWSRAKGGDLFIRSLVSLTEGYHDKPVDKTDGDVVPAGW